MKEIFILSFTADTARINVLKINGYAIIDMAIRVGEEALVSHSFRQQ